MPENPANPTLDAVLLPKLDDQPPPQLLINAAAVETVTDVTAGINENAAMSGAVQPPTDQPAQDDRPKWHSEPLSSFQLDDTGKVKIHPRTRKPIRHKGKGGRPAKAKPGERLAGGGVAPGAPGTTESPTVSVIDPDAAAPVTADQVNRNTPTAPGEDDLDAAEVFTELADDVAEGVGGDKSRMTKAEKTTIRKGMGSMTRGRRVFGPLLFFAGCLAWGLRLWITNRKDSINDGNDTRGGDRRQQDGQEHVSEVDEPPGKRGW